MQYKRNAITIFLCLTATIFILGACFLPELVLANGQSKFSIKELSFKPLKDNFESSLHLKEFHELLKHQQEKENSYNKIGKTPAVMKAPDTVEYRDNRLFIRFKEGSGLSVVAEKLASQKNGFSQITGNSDLDNLNKKYDLKEIKPLIDLDLKHSIDSFTGPLTSKIALDFEKEKELELTEKVINMNKRFYNRSQSANADLQVKYLHRLSSIFVMEFNNKSFNIEQIKAVYESDDNVEFVDYVKKYYAFYEPDDPYYSSSGSWGNSYRDMYGLTPDFLHTGDPLQDNGAWAKSKGQGVIVAVIDSGVDYTHPDIFENMWQNDQNEYGYDFVNQDTDPMDDHGHGTHCAGTIAAKENGIGIIGVAPLAEIMAIKGLDSQGDGYEDDLASAIYFAVENGADLLNNSWSGRGYSQILEDTFALAQASGCVNIASAGNSDFETSAFMPANLQSVIAVAAIDSNSEKADFSNFGMKVDVTAPGVEILSLRARNTDFYENGEHIVDDIYYRSNGTSMAAPHVAGTLALMRALHPEFTPEQMRSALRFSAVNFSDSGFDETFGHGMLNADAALDVSTPLAAKIFSPKNFKQYFENEIIEIRGVAYGESFNSYTVEYALSLEGPWMVADNITFGEKYPEAGTGGEIEYPILATLNVLEQATPLYLKLSVSSQAGDVYEDYKRVVNNWENGKIIGSDVSSGSGFGFYQIAIQGDKAVIGCASTNNYFGSAYIYSKDEDGNWPHFESKALVNPNPEATVYGLSVSASNNTIIVGSFSYVYIYEQNLNGTWPETYTQRINWNNQQKASFHFGGSVFLIEDTLFIGDGNSSISGASTGAVYVFKRNAQGTFPPIANSIILPNDSKNSNQFGTSISTQEDTLVIGDFNDDTNGTNAGAAYIFKLNENTALWEEEQKILPSDGSSQSSFGAQVSLSGNTAIVGAHTDDSIASNLGAAYIFVENSDGNWPENETRKILPSDGIQGGCFGRSVAIEDDIILVGSYGGSLGNATYLYTRNSSGAWPETETTRIVPPENELGSFGTQVALSESKMLIGNAYGLGNFFGSGNAFILSRYNIQGVVSENGAPLEGVLVTTNDPNITPITTGADGTYRFVVQQDWSGTVETFKEGYTFNPLTPIYYTSVNEDIVQNYSTGMSAVSQEIHFNAGWNMISFNVEPVNMSVESIFAPLISQGNLVIIKGDSGHVFWPEYGINTIGEIDVKEGYQVKVNEQATLSLVANPVSLPTTVTLSPGWQMIGYPLDQPFNIEDVFAGHQEDIIVVQDGQGHVYWPETNINTIGQMQPGKGYQVKVSNAFDLIYRYEVAIITQNLTFDAGMNFFAPTVQAESMLIEDLLAPLVAEGNLQMAYDRNYNFFNPGSGVNNFTEPLSPGNGVVIQLNSATTMTLAGTLYLGQTNVELFSGYNFIGFLADKNAMDTIAGLIDPDNDSLWHVEDVQGEKYIEKVDGVWIDGIGQFEAGRAYLFSMKKTDYIDID